MTLKLLGNFSAYATSALGIYTMQPVDFGPFRFWFTYPGIIVTATLVKFFVDIQIRNRNARRYGSENN